MGIFDMFKKKEVSPFIPFDEIENIKGNLDDFQKRIIDTSLIILITGKRGSGKTSLGMKLIELVNKKSKRKCYVIGYKKINLPSYIKKAEKIEDVQNNSVCLIDESAILYSARDSFSKSNKLLGTLMTIARHKNLTLFLIVQNSGMVDVNVLRLTDVLLLKEPSLLQTKFERKGIKEIYDKAHEHFEKSKLKDFPRKSLVYVLDDEYEAMISYGLPSFWDDKISKGFSNYK